MELEPHSCTCPSHNYTCTANSVTGMTWRDPDHELLQEPVTYLVIDLAKQDRVSRGVVFITFHEVMVNLTHANLTSHLFINDIHSLNLSDVVCTAFNFAGTDNDTVNICIIGKTDFSKIHGLFSTT